MFFGKGYPATKAFGYGKAVPAFGAAVAPGFGAFGKPFGAFGKPFGAFGKPFGAFGKPFGFPATKAGGFGAAVPATTVATAPAAI
ncbi:MAG: hypothetical protein ACOY94_02480 [Bacillota bacterium]